jgi:hypothetical protein
LVRFHFAIFFCVDRQVDLIEIFQFSCLLFPFCKFQTRGMYRDGKGVGVVVKPHLIALPRPVCIQKLEHVCTIRNCPD